jgi:hypothetical protein
VVGVGGDRRLNQVPPAHPLDPALVDRDELRGLQGDEAKNFNAKSSDKQLEFLEANFARYSGSIAIFGGSFNPPHVAHVLAVTFVLATAEVDRVLVVPTFQHPFAKALASYEDRVRMCTLAMGWLPRVEVSRVEEELGGESLTLRTLEHLHAQHPDWQMRLVIGADVLVDSH